MSIYNGKFVGYIFIEGKKRGKLGLFNFYYVLIIVLDIFLKFIDNFVYYILLIIFIGKEFDV